MKADYRGSYSDSAAQKSGNFMAVRKAFLANLLEAPFNLEIFKLALEDEFSDKNLKARRERELKKKEDSDPDKKP